MGRGEAKFDDAGTGGVVGLEAVLVALSPFHGVDGLEFFNRLTHLFILSKIFFSGRTPLVNHTEENGGFYEGFLSL